MSQMQRLRKLESKTHDRLLAFFALPRRLDNRKEVELQLWNDYLENGGNKTATPAFLPTEAYGFICCVEVAFVKEWLKRNFKLGPI